MLSEGRPRCTPTPHPFFTRTRSAPRPAPPCPGRRGRTRWIRQSGGALSWPHGTRAARAAGCGTPAGPPPQTWAVAPPQPATPGRQGKGGAGRNAEFCSWIGRLAQKQGGRSAACQSRSVLSPAQRFGGTSSRPLPLPSSHQLCCAFSWCLLLLLRRPSCAAAAEAAAVAVRAVCCPLGAVGATYSAGTDVQPFPATAGG